MSNYKQRRKKGEGTIVKRKNSTSCQAAIYVPQPTGKSKRTYYYGTERECVDWLTQIRYDIHTGKAVTSADTTLYEWLYKWLDRYCINIRDSTRMNYVTYIERHIRQHRIASIPLKHLTTDDIQGYIAFLKKSGKLSGDGGLSAKTIRNILQMLRTSLKQAVGNHLIWSNPADYCQMPRMESKETHFLSTDEMQRLLCAAKCQKWEIGIVLLMFTGMRIGELMALRHDSLCTKEGITYLDIRSSLKRVSNYGKAGRSRTVLEVSETKTEHSRRQIPLLPVVAALLKEHLHAQKKTTCVMNPFIISNDDGNFVDPTTFRKWFNTMVENAGITTHVTPHTLRRTWATHSLRKGLSAQYIADMLGHSSTSVTEKYYLLSDMEGKNNELLKLEKMANDLLENEN